MMIIITVTFVITKEKNFWTLPVHTITIAKKQWSPLIFNMATILTKEVKDVHLLHSSGHTPTRLKAFSPLFVKKPFLTIFKAQFRAYSYTITIFNMATILKIGRLVPEPTKLGYQSGYFEKRLMNQPSFQFSRSHHPWPSLSTWEWFFSLWIAKVVHIFS